LIPRWIQCKRVTFKYGLGDQFINVLRTLKMLGLDNKNPVKVKDVYVAPRDVVAACLPDPAHLGDKMSGKTCAGTWVKGLKNGKLREVYIYQVADNELCMRTLGVQAVVAQTAFNPVIAWELLQAGIWKGEVYWDQKHLIRCLLWIECQITVSHMGSKRCSREAISKNKVKGCFAAAAPPQNTPPPIFEMTSN